MKPPTGGPTTGPISAGTVSQASEPTSSVFDTVRRITSRPTGTIIAPPMPWTTRAKTISPIELDSPHRIEPMVKMTIGEAEDRARAEAVGEPAGGRDEDGDGEEIGGERQLQVDRALAEIPRDRRQRRGEHRRIEVLHEQRAGDDERKQDAIGHQQGDVGGRLGSERTEPLAPSYRRSVLLE